MSNKNFNEMFDISNIKKTRLEERIKNLETSNEITICDLLSEYLFNSDSDSDSDNDNDIYSDSDEFYVLDNDIDINELFDLDDY